MEYTGKERRASSLTTPDKSIDRELGELVASVRALSDKVDQQRADIEKLSQKMTEYQNGHDHQSRVDYAYLDDKIDRVMGRVGALEKHNEIIDVASKSGAFGKIKTRFIESIGSLLAAGFFAVLLWIASQYFQRG